MSTTTQHTSREAEENLLGLMLRYPDERKEILRQGADPTIFAHGAYRLIFTTIRDRFERDEDDVLDPLVIGEQLGPRLAAGWKVDEPEAISRVKQLGTQADVTKALVYLNIVVKHAAYREMQKLLARATNEAQLEARSPEAIAGELATQLTKLVQGTLKNAETVDYMGLGSGWRQQTLQEIAVMQAGGDVGAMFGIQSLDTRLRGLRPGELMMLGGDPGVGKTALALRMVRNFAVRQAKHPEGRRTGALLVSLEMGSEQIQTRMATIETTLTGDQLQAARVTVQDVEDASKVWSQQRIPLWSTFPSMVRQSQLKALVERAVHEHAVGLVVIDHFRFLRTDEKFGNKNDADDELVRFLKADLARDLHCAVICLAHTTKTQEFRKPVMDDLRGSKMISAFGDFVVFLHHPWRQMDDGDRATNPELANQYQLIWAKSRRSSGEDGTLFMDLNSMDIH